MTTEEKNNKIVEDLLKDLGTNDPKTLTSALKRVRSKGNEKVIPSLFKIIEESTEENIVEESKKNHFGAKVYSCHSLFIRRIRKQQEFRNQRTCFEFVLANRI